MKSAKEWFGSIQNIPAGRDYDFVGATRTMIGEIQLDAFKAGAEWLSKRLDIACSEEISNLKEIPK